MTSGACAEQRPFKRTALDAQQFRQLYVRHHASLFHFATRSLAEPAAAEALVYDVMQNVRHRGVAAGSMHETRIHLLKMVYQRCQTLAADKDTAPANTAQHDAQTYERTDDCHLSDIIEIAKDELQVMAAIATLSQIERQVLHLALVENLGYRAIETITSHPAAKVRATILLLEKNLLNCAQGASRRGYDTDG